MLNRIILLLSNLEELINLCKEFKQRRVIFFLLFKKIINITWMNSHIIYFCHSFYCQLV